MSMDFDSITALVAKLGGITYLCAAVTKAYKVIVDGGGIVGILRALFYGSAHTDKATEPQPTPKP